MGNGTLTSGSEIKVLRKLNNCPFKHEMKNKDVKDELF